MLVVEDAMEALSKFMFINAVGRIFIICVTYPITSQDATAIIIGVLDFPPTPGVFLDTPLDNSWLSHDNVKNKRK